MLLGKPETKGPAVSFDSPYTAVALIYLENLKLVYHLGVFAGNEAPYIYNKSLKTRAYVYEDMYWIHLAQAKVQLQDIFNKAMDLPVTRMADNFSPVAGYLDSQKLGSVELFR